MAKSKSQGRKKKGSDGGTPNSGRQKQKPCHPSHLKGREINEWYKNKKREEAEAKAKELENNGKVMDTVEGVSNETEEHADKEAPEKLDVNNVSVETSSQEKENTTQKENIKLMDTHTANVGSNGTEDHADKKETPEKLDVSNDNVSVETSEGGQDPEATTPQQENTEMVEAVNGNDTKERNDKTEAMEKLAVNNESGETSTGESGEEKETASQENTDV